MLSPQRCCEPDDTHAIFLVGQDLLLVEHQETTVTGNDRVSRIDKKDECKYALHLTIFSYLGYYGTSTLGCTSINRMSNRAIPSLYRNVYVYLHIIPVIYSRHGIQWQRSESVTRNEQIAHYFEVKNLYNLNVWI